MPTHWATKDLENIDFDKIRYYLSQGQKPKRTWDEVPDDIKKTFERLGIPEQERKFLAGVEAQFDSEAAYSNIKDIVAKQGVIFCQLHRGPPRAPRDLPEILRQSHPDRRQQILRAQQRRVLRRLVHLRAAGREGRPAAPGLLPHQRRKLRPVRAHPHHRRRRLRGRLHGGLHRPEVLHLHAAQRRRRTRRPQGRQDPIHHRPELGEQRLQPRHQARRRPRGRRDQVDRLQHRQPPHDEVSRASS